MLLGSKRFVSLVAWSIVAFLTYHTLFVTMPCAHQDTERCDFGRIDQGSAMPSLLRD